MKTLKTIVGTLLVLVLLAIGWTWSGMYDIAADRPHTRPVSALLEVLRERSIELRASDIEVPPLDDEAQIRAGAGNYDAMCSGCHLAPGMAETELSRGLYPAPPNLAQTGVDDPAEVFWAIKHGIKATGMPAWGKSMEDEYIWGMVALLRQLPEMTPQRYQALVASSEGHSHGGGEPGGDHAHAHDESGQGGEHEDVHEDTEKHDHDGQPHQHDSPGTGGHEHGADAHPEAPADGGGNRHPAHAVAAAASPQVAARALHEALSSGDAAMVQVLLDPEVLILESGGAERSRAEYAAHHMKGDMAFLKDADYTLLRQSGDSVGDLAWVATEARIAASSKGRPVDLLSTETLVLKKGADGWKVVHVHWSSRPVAKPSAGSDEHKS